MMIDASGIGSDTCVKLGYKKKRMLSNGSDFINTILPKNMPRGNDFSRAPELTVTQVSGGSLGSFGGASPHHHHRLRGGQR